MGDKTPVPVGGAPPRVRALFFLALFGFACSAVAQSLGDPMAPTSASSIAGATGAGTSGKPELQGVILSPGRRLALINGAIVPVGENVPGDGTVVDVQPEGATVRSDGNVQVLRLNPEGGKKDRKQ